MFDTKQTDTNIATKDGILLSATQKQAYDRDGFLVLKNFVANDICENLIERARWLINRFDENEVKVIFSTIEQHHSKSLYFLDSGDKIRFFFEEGAIDPDGKLKTDKLFCINKIGHALHDLDPVFNCFSRMHKTAALVKDLNIVDPLLVQSMYICKQPFIGGEVNCHQDSTYMFIENQPITGLWFALEDSTLENGCLWAIPGGHKEALKTRMMRDKNNHIAVEIYDDKSWPLEKMVPLEVPRGGLIVLHGLLPHLSKENISPRSRHAYTLHVMSGRCKYAQDNWLQRPKEMPFKGFL